MENKETAKHKVVRQALTESIRRGEYKPGERIPAERDLAELYGVSYMTARRAVTELVEVDLLRRRPREGTFVPPRSAKRLAAKTVHLVCPGFGSPTMRTFLQAGDQKAEARGWRTEVIQLHHSQVRPVARALDGGDLMVMLPSGPDLETTMVETLQKAEGRAVLLGNRLDHLGVPSVMADDAEGIRLAMRHLHEFGHREIAIMTATPDHNVDRVQIEAWRAVSPADWNEEHFAQRTIVVNTPRHDSHDDYVYRMLGEYLAGDNEKTTAIICLLERMALPALAACRDAGRAVPDKISLIAAGNNPTLAYAQPPVTCIDVHVEEHMEKALHVLDKVLMGKLANSDLLHLVKPHLELRKSVQSPPTTRKVTQPSRAR